MKISDAILYCIWKAGGQVPHYKFQNWIRHLVEAKYIEHVFVKGTDVCHLKITEKGVQKLIANKIIEGGVRCRN